MSVDGQDTKEDRPRYVRSTVDSGSRDASRFLLFLYSMNKYLIGIFIKGGGVVTTILFKTAIYALIFYDLRGDDHRVGRGRATVRLGYDVLLLLFLLQTGYHIDWLLVREEVLVRRQHFRRVLHLHLLTVEHQ